MVIGNSVRHVNPESVDTVMPALERLVAYLAEAAGKNNDLAKNMAVIAAHQLQAGFWLINCLLRCRLLSVTVKRCRYASTQPDYATFSVLNGAGFTLAP